jgi:nucleoside 2-deoxyribosyltransferase
MKNKIYLSGGMKSGWQQIVKTAFYIPTSGTYWFEFFNPANHNLSDSKEYTAWDLFYTKHCDILFASMEESNPSGFGLALEIGYAKALGKTIILVDEKSKTDESFAGKFKIVRESSTVVFEDFDKGVEFLESFCQ